MNRNEINDSIEFLPNRDAKIHELIIANIDQDFQTDNRIKDQIIRAKLDGYDVNAKISQAKIIAIFVDQQKNSHLRRIHEKISSIDKDQFSPLALAILIEDHQLIKVLIADGADLKEPILKDLAYQMISSQIDEFHDTENVKINRQAIFSTLIYSGVDLKTDRDDKRKFYCDPSIIQDANIIGTLNAKNPILITCSQKEIFIESFKKCLEQFSSMILVDKRERRSADSSGHKKSSVSIDGRISNRNSIDLGRVCDPLEQSLIINGLEIKLNKFLFIELANKISLESDRKIESSCCGLFARSSVRKSSNQKLTEILSSQEQKNLLAIERSTKQVQEIDKLFKENRVRLNTMLNLRDDLCLDHGVEQKLSEVISTESNINLEIPMTPNTRDIQQQTLRVHRSSKASNDIYEDDLSLDLSSEDQKQKLQRLKKISDSASKLAESFSDENFDQEDQSPKSESTRQSLDQQSLVVNKASALKRRSSSPDL